MRIVMTSDLHYNVARSREPARELAGAICAGGGDVLVLLGDTASSDLDTFAEALSLFAGFPGLKLLVPGNHCLWCRQGESSVERYRDKLPEVSAKAGFKVLDHEPQVLDLSTAGQLTGRKVGLAGSIGWYDYSFRDALLGIPLDFYRAKLSPGAAQYLGMDDLINKHAADLTPRQLSMAMRWADGQHVHLGMTDEQFTAMLADSLRSQLRALSGQVDQIVVFLHHLPFEQLVHGAGGREGDLPRREHVTDGEHDAAVPHGNARRLPDRIAFAAAYLGSQRLGEVLMEFPKITHVYCGHVHWRTQLRIGGMQVTSLGSTYKHKEAEELEL